MTVTPMMRQYLDLKQRHPDAILFFRLGDFYEMFYEDAELASRELQLTLTSRQAGADQKAPMCGVPYHAAEQYIARLVRKGYRVAICEQIEDPALAKGLVRRDVIRVITPGTLMSDNASEGTNHYIASLAFQQDVWSLALADLSTGEFRVSTYENQAAKLQVIEELAALGPAEAIADEHQPIPEEIQRQVPCWTLRPRSDFRLENAAQSLRRHFQVADVRSLGLEDSPQAVRAAGALLLYLQETQKIALRQFTRIKIVSPGGSMRLDAATRRSLELTSRSQDGSHAGSLISVLDKTITSMGRRCLRNWVCFPLTDLEEIQARHQAVEEWVADSITRHSIEEILRSIYDIERLNAKVAMRSANARDLVSLRQSLRDLPKLKLILDQAQSPLIRRFQQEIHPIPELYDLLERAIEDEPPASLNEGGLIRAGFHERVDRLRDARKNGRKWIADLEQRERERTGIRSLKVGYNKVFGYYLEVTNANLSLVPQDYQRKQTLANAERFVTDELKEQERLILEAEQELTALEHEIFVEIREEAAKHAVFLQKTASALGALDALLSLAKVAADHRYVKPEMHLQPTLEIEQGRHPVLEQTMPPGAFVPNDIKLGLDNGQVAIITGPNMAGKSTFARQTALIVLMAQVGSFVPARRASIGITDRIFSRMGASDDISGGLSTFMVEMTEVANILHHATQRSLIILDEVGRGTSTYDGMSIAWAIVEYLHDRIGARTLFTTHYHELTQMARYLPGLRNFTVAVKEDKDEITFLRQVIPGAADRSYGIHVARLAGLPAPVIARAKERLRILESTNGNSMVYEDTQIALPMEYTEDKPDVPGAAARQILQQLHQLPIMNMTPLEVVNQVYAWQQELNEADDGLSA